MTWAPRSVTALTTPKRWNSVRPIQSAIEQRFAEFKGGEKAYIPGTVNKLDASTPEIQREFFDFYRTERGGYTAGRERGTDDKTDAEQYR